jgi:hypothetical protein
VRDQPSTTPALTPALQAQIRDLVNSQFNDPICESELTDLVLAGIRAGLEQKREQSRQVIGHCGSCGGTEFQVVEACSNCGEAEVLETLQGTPPPVSGGEE